MDFFSALSLYAPQAHLVVTGELDAFAASGLWPRLDEAIDRGCIRFTVDASAVTFLDAGGLGMLIRLRNAVTPFGGTVTVAAASPRFRQIVEVTGLETVLDLDLLAASSESSDPRVVPLGRHGSRDGAHRWSGPASWPGDDAVPSAVSAR